MAQTSDTGTEAEQAPARRRSRRGRRAVACLAIGILAGVGITPGLAGSRRGTTRPPRSRRAPTRPKLCAEHPTARTGASGATGPCCAGRGVDRLLLLFHLRPTWAGGDGVLAIRLNDTQLAWFFSDTFIGPAGPNRRLAPQRVRAQRSGRPDHDRSGQHVRHHDRLRSLHRSRRPGERGPGGRAAFGRPRRGVRPVLGRGRHRDRRDSRQVLQPLPRQPLSVRPGGNGDRRLPGQPAQHGRPRPHTARSAVATEIPAAGQGGCTTAGRR